MYIKQIKSNSNEVYLYPLGDIHIGDNGFGKVSEEKLKGYIDWIKNTPNAFAFLMGDLVNCATLGSPSSPFQQNLDLAGQIKKVVELFEPIKDKIVGAIDGNHESRLIKYSGYSPTISICERLGGVSYFGPSGIIIFRLGCRNGKSPRHSFTGYFHHTTGGGRTVGAKMNRVDMLRDIIPNADFYCGGHNHQLGVIHNVTHVVNQTTGKMDVIKQMIIDCGGYLEWNDSYAESMMLRPLKIGSPRVHMMLHRNNKSKTIRGKKKSFEEVVTKDLHVSI